MCSSDLDGRIDFRELVKDLAYEFRARIEMRQIGVRDQARMYNGFGHCGRELCCSSFLEEFEPVTIKMAKTQNLTLNPNKLSGVCGRLMCCLMYEYSSYREINRNLPKYGKKVRLPDGQIGRVRKINTMSKKLLLELIDLEIENIILGRELTKKFETIYRGHPKNVLEELETDTVKGEFVVVINR